MNNPIRYYMLIELRTTHKQLIVMENQLNWEKLQSYIKRAMSTNEIITHIVTNRDIVISRENYQVLPDVINLLKISYKIFPVTVINSQLGTNILSECFSIDDFIGQLVENFDLIYEEPISINDIEYIIKFDSIHDCVTNWEK